MVVGRVKNGVTHSVNIYHKWSRDENKSAGTKDGEARPAPLFPLGSFLLLFLIILSPNV